MSHLLAENPDLVRAYIDAIEPPEDIPPSEFAEKYLWIKGGVTSNHPVRWSNDVFPYLVQIMDLIEEAIRKKKRGVVIPKPGQAGGSSAMICVWAWLAVTYGGPILYLISKDEHAVTFMEKRFDFLCKKVEKLKKRWINKRGVGNNKHNRIFYDGSLTVLGGGSNRNLESNPFRFVFVDEPDSIPADMQGYGDPVSLAEVRTDAFPGDTLVIVFSHPTTEDRGTGKLYEESSDKRRGYVQCPHCPGEFFLTWDHVKVFPHEGQTEAAAKNDPSCYQYFAPCCGVEITDAERYRIARNVTQKSTLSPEEANRKEWISGHFSHLYMNNKPLRKLASRYIDGFDDPNKAKVFQNKSMGETYAEKEIDTEESDWKKLVHLPRFEGDPLVYSCEEVPSEVQFLTAGQDSRETQLHWNIWGWGNVRDVDGNLRFCAWLINAAIIPRQKSPILNEVDLKPLDGFLYDRSYQKGNEDQLWVRQSLHDSGWQPNGVYDYCRSHRGIGYPCKGASKRYGASDKDPESTAEFISWRALPEYVSQGAKVREKVVKLALINTYQLKKLWLGMALRRFQDSLGFERSIINFPTDVPGEFVKQMASEKLVKEKGKSYWQRKGSNHFLDTAIYAFASALNIRARMKKETAEERAHKEKVGQPRYRRRKDQERERDKPRGRGGYKKWDGESQGNWTIGRG